MSNIKHFPGVHATWVEAGREHWGIIILIGHSAISAWLRRMENLLNRFSAEIAYMIPYWTISASEALFCSPQKTPLVQLGQVPLNWLFLSSENRASGALTVEEL